jgi:hypothetical protein
VLYLIPCGPRFLLASNREYEDRVKPCDEAIQSHIAAGTASDYQLPEIAPHGPTNQWIVLEYIDGAHDGFDALRQICNLMLYQMFNDPIEIVRYLGCELDMGHNGSALRHARLRADTLAPTKSALQVTAHVRPRHRFS